MRPLVHAPTLLSLQSLLTRLPWRLPRYVNVHRRFSRYTMIYKTTYVRNLALVHQFSQVPGTVVECGVWRGGMIAGLATLLGPAREYHLFDSFECVFSSIFKHFGCFFGRREFCSLRILLATASLLERTF